MAEVYCMNNTVSEKFLSYLAVSNIVGIFPWMKPILLMHHYNITSISSTFRTTFIKAQSKFMRDGH